MNRTLLTAIMAVAATVSALATARAELLAMLNFESKADQTIRREAIAVMDIDPASDGFGRILAEIPMPPDLVTHHIFYDPDLTKAYVTALGKPELRIFDMQRFPFAQRIIPLPDCAVGEDIAFSRPNGRWYMTCMGSSTLVVGDAVTDTVIGTIELPAPYPHGINIHDGIDRMLVTSTVNPANMEDAGESIVEMRPSTGEILAVHKVSERPSPSSAAPVEVFFVPEADPPVAYITNLYEGTLWLAEWKPEEQAFSFRSVFDFKPLGQEMPLEVHFNAAADRAYVTTAKPGHLNIFDIGDPRSPRHLQAIEAAGGAHHMVLSSDEGLAFVQNSLLNLPGLNDGSISVIDLAKGEKVGSIDTLKNQGLAPNSIVLLPGYGHGGAH